MSSATIERDLRTARSLWLDSFGTGVRAKPLGAPIKVDVAIIGAGISGAFMAYELSKTHSVVVLERRAPLMGSTIASTALLQWELDLPLTALSDKIGAADAKRVYRRSRETVRDLIAIVRDERIACGLKPKSSLYLAGDDYGARALASEADARAAMGLDSVFLHPAQLRQTYGIERTGAILSTGSASADPGRLAAGLFRRAIQSGAQVHAPVEVSGVLRGGGHLTVVTDAGVEVQATHVVYCCGYEFPKGVPTERAKIISTWALATRPMSDIPGWLRRHLVWEASDPYLYFRTTSDNRIVIGGEDEASPTRQADPKLLATKSAVILKKLKALLPNLNLEIDYAWAGAFGESVTSMPLIGAVPGAPNIYAVMGFGGNGITYSVVASQIVGAAVRGRPDPDAPLFRFDAARDGFRA